jgi:polyisoprenoid-binding protein YceI
MPSRCLAAAAVMLFLHPVFAQSPQKILAEKSQIRFGFRQMNAPVEGRFRTFEASVDFDPRKPEATKAEFEVDLGSIDLGTAEGEAEAKRKSWLNIDAFPKARFVARSVKVIAPGRYEATGPLTIKGITQDITAPFTMVEAGGVRTVEGTFALRRLQFRIGDGPWADTDTVADEVNVRFKFVMPSTTR